MLKRIVLISVLLTYIVIVFGAYVRLTDAGLGCPDWPGCYGHLTVPESQAEQHSAMQNFPGKEIETGKAWREMTHRYLAGTLGLLILLIAILSWLNRHHGAPVKTPIVLLGLVIFQALLGMWTVTLLLKPVIVTLHLLGGMTILGILVWLAMKHFSAQPDPAVRVSISRNWAIVGIAILFTQIALGGWVSSNYAALACTDFPLCDSQWIPSVDFKHGFQIIRELGVTKDGAPLSSEAMNAIHWTHRVGALVTFVYLLVLGLTVLKDPRLRVYGGLLLVFLLAQVSIGVANIIYSLPLPLAVAHNAGAALLVIALVLLSYKLKPGR